MNFEFRTKKGEGTQRRKHRFFAAAFCSLQSAFLAISGCAGPAPPVAVDTNSDACHWCRMSISNPRLVAEVLDPGEEPRLFDDIGCAANEIAGERQHPRNRRIFVTDYSTGRWLDAQAAVFERCPAIDTPMSSHLIARATRSADPGCTPIPATEIFR